LIQRNERAGSTGDHRREQEARRLLGRVVSDNIGRTKGV